MTSTVTKSYFNRAPLGCERFTSWMWMNTITLILTKISEECSQHLVESISGRNKPVMNGKSKGLSQHYPIKWLVNVEKLRIYKTGFQNSTYQIHKSKLQEYRKKNQKPRQKVHNSKLVKKTYPLPDITTTDALYNVLMQVSNVVVNC